MYNIRKAEISDFDGILKLQLELEDVEIEFDNNLKRHSYALDDGKEKLKNRIKNENIIFYVVINDKNEIIAFLDGRIPNDEWWYKHTVAYLDHICVNSDYRNIGIGTALLNRFEMEAKEKGAKYIRILTFYNNKTAISFYKKNKYIEYSTYYNKIIN